MTGVALAHCILGKFLGVVCHCLPPINCIGCIKKRSWHISSNWLGICQVVENAVTHAVQGSTYQEITHVSTCSERSQMANNCKSQLHPVHTPTPHFLKIRLNIILSSTPGSPTWSLFQVSPPKPCI